MGLSITIWLVLWVAMSSLSHAYYRVELKHVSTIYLPYTFQGDTPQFSFLENAVEKAVLEPSGKIVYAVGENILHIVNASDPSNLAYLNHVPLPNKELTDVEACGGAVFVTYIDKNDPLHGGVLQYEVYTAQAGNVIFKRDIKIGTQPDMLRATKNCTLVVALENTAVNVGGTLQDPPGGVGIIRFPGGVSNSPHTTTLDFTAFDHRFNGLAQSGVRWVYRANNNKFSNDIEPESVAFNAEQTKAYICIQENNAVAVVDLASDNITSVMGLGFKNWTLFRLDPSDRDNGINMAPWPVLGMYQPDAIQVVRWMGKDYVITTNEGDAKEYESVNFEEDQRGNDFNAQQFASSVSADLRQALANNSRLGRLKLSKIDGKDSQGKFEKFYTYGARSFSIRRASDMALIFDSGSELNDKTILQRSDLFNTDIPDNENTRVVESMDKRSDNKGPEPESVAVAEFDGALLIFIGLERPGTIAVYSVAPGDSRMQPRFESLYTDGIPQSNMTWAQLYAARKLHAVDPESISYVPRETGLADYPMLLVAGGGSGTLSFLKIQVTGSPTGSGVLPSCSILTIVTGLILAAWKPV